MRTKHLIMCLKEFKDVEIKIVVADGFCNETPPNASIKTEHVYVWVKTPLHDQETMGEELELSSKKGVPRNFITVKHALFRLQEIYLKVDGNFKRLCPTVSFWEVDDKPIKSSELSFEEEIEVKIKISKVI